MTRVLTAPIPAAPSSVTVRRGGRLVMHRAAADTPEFWEAQWRAHPPVAMTGMKIDPWLRSLAHRYLSKDGLIVEAGCGNGNICRTFANDGFQIEGLDFAPRAIEANRRLDGARGRYTVGDVRALPYADGSLAGYISLGVIEHFDDATRAQILRETARVLRPGGIALISTPAFNPLRRLASLWGRYTPPPAREAADTDRPYDLPFYQYLFTMRELSRDVRAAGLRVIARDGYDLFKGLKDTLPCKDFLKRRWPKTGRLAAYLHHPAKPLRRFAAHMQVVIAVKP